MDNKATTVHSKNQAAKIRRLQPRRPDVIGLRLTQSIELVQVEDIICCEAWSNYCKIHLKDRSEPVLLSKPLKHVISGLPDAHYFRPHQSFVIRLDAIASVGEHIVLNNGMSVPMSRRHKPRFMTWLKQNITLI